MYRNMVYLVNNIFNPIYEQMRERDLGNMSYLIASKKDLKE